MPLRVHWLQHVPFEGLGSIEPWLRERGHAVSCTRLFAGEPLPDVAAFDWLIVMGGPMNADETCRHPWLTAERRLIGAALAANKRVLGICLGAQIMARALGAEVAPDEPEIGWFDVELTPIGAISPFFADFPATFPALHWHGDRFSIPDGARRAAGSAACANQAFVYGERAVGLQCHLEITPDSAAVLVDHCRHELVAAPWVQSERAMLSCPQRFAELNGLMAALLARLEAA